MNWEDMLKNSWPFDINKEGNAEIFIEEVEKFIENGVYFDEDITDSLLSRISLKHEDSKKLIEIHLRKMRELDIAHFSQPSISSYGLNRPQVPMIKKLAQAISEELRGWEEAPFWLKHGGTIVRR